MSSLLPVRRMIDHFRRCSLRHISLRRRHFQLMTIRSNHFHSRSACTIYSNTVPQIMCRQRAHYINSRNFSTSNTSPNPNQPPNQSSPKPSDTNDDTEDYGYFTYIPRFRNIHHWDKYEWIFSFSSMVQFIGFLSYDYMLLRVLSLLSASGLMIAHTGRRFFVGWFWAFSFASANIIALWYMLREKYSHDLGGLTQEQAQIYFTYFEPFAITPLEYKQIAKIGHFVTMKRGETLTIHGLISDNVFLLLSGQCIVINDAGETVGIISGGTKKSFVGEIALIDDTQDEATATVKTDSEQCRVLLFNVEDMKYFLRNTKAELRVKLTNVFTSSMKLKLLAFNAKFNVETSIQYDQNALESIVQMLLISKGKIEILEDQVREEDERKNRKYKLLVDDEETISLNAEEQLFLSQYIDDKQINDKFVQKLYSEYRIESDL